MKTIIATILLLGAIHSAEVYATDTNGYVDQTAWKEKLLSDKYQGDEQTITNAPRYIEENVTAPPKVLTQKITAEPKVINEQLELPIR